MQEIITKNYGGFVVEFELVRGRVLANATSMCAIFEKRPAKWLELDSTKRYIAALEVKSENRISLVETRKGNFGDGAQQGTWIDERLILKLAQWLDVDFEIQCDEWIAELLRTGRVALTPVRTPAELLLQQCQQLVDQERRVKSLEIGQANLQEQVSEVAAKQTTIDREHYAVSGYASLHHIRLPMSEAKQYGKLAAKLSKEQHYSIDKVPDAKFGKVNAYHVDILKQVFSVIRN